MRSNRLILWTLLATAAGVVAALLWSPLQTSTGSIEEMTKSRSRVGSASASSHMARLPVAKRMQAHAPSPNPDSPTYDPGQLIGLKGWTVEEVYQEEPRKNSFAKPREVFLRSELEQFLSEKYPDAHVTGFDCRTSSCRIEVEGNATTLGAMSLYIQRLPLGTWFEPGTFAEEDREGLLFHVSFNPEMREHEHHDEWFKRGLEAKHVYDDLLWDPPGEP